MGKFGAFSVAMLLAVAGCVSSSDKGNESGGKDLVVIDENKHMTERDLRLSTIADELEIIRLEDTDEAITKFWRPAISENYLAIIQGASLPVKLFNRQGKYIGTVGNIGDGPGEYNMVYECAIDEANNAIYLTTWFGKIMQYDLNGTFVKELGLKCGGKPTLGILPDGGVSTVSLCLDDNEQVAAQIRGDGKTAVADYPPLHVPSRNANGEGIAFNNEIFAFRNVEDHVFMPTSTDTLYAYSAAINAIGPRCVVRRTEPKPEEWVTGTELPTGILMTVFGPDTRNYWVEKSTGETSRINLVNDMLANNKLYPNQFHDGYYIQCFEPGDLADKIEDEWMSESSLTDEQKLRLEELAKSIDPDGNNIILLGKLKRK